MRGWKGTDFLVSESREQTDKRRKGWKKRDGLSCRISTDLCTGDGRQPIDGADDPGIRQRLKIRGAVASGLVILPVAIPEGCSGGCTGKLRGGLLRKNCYTFRVLHDF